MADSRPGMRMINRSAVDENTEFLSGLTDTTRAKATVALSGDITGSFQSDVFTVEKKQTVINEEDDQETHGQHPVSSKQQVGELLIVSSKLDDTAELNIDVNEVTTLNQSIVDELYTEQSSSISYENYVILDRASYPETIQGCIQVINEPCHAEKALHLTITENEHLLWCLQAEALNAQQKLEKEYRERKYWETEYHRGSYEVRNGRGHGGGSRTGSQTSTEVGRGERQRSKSREPATPEVNSRQADRRPAYHRRDITRPSYNINRQQQNFHEAWQNGHERQGRVGVADN